MALFWTFGISKAFGLFNVIVEILDLKYELLSKCLFERSQQNRG